MLNRLFDEGPDRKQYFDVDRSLAAEVEHEAVLLAQAPGRTLVAFRGRDLDKPSWVPQEHLRFELYPGQIHEEFGAGVATLPEWLWVALDQLTYAALCTGRDERAASEAEKRRERAAQLRRQEKAHTAAAKKTGEKPPEQGSLF